MNKTLYDKMHESGVIAVLVIDDVGDAVPLANALLAGGVDMMELTLRTPAAMGALAAITENVRDMCVGIGTVLTPHQVKQVKDLGAAFGVAPGLNSRVVEAARDVGLPFSPGIVTPSDIERAVELGCEVLKFFPAEPSGGLPYLKSMAAPYAHLHLKYVPLGGLNQENLATYLESPLVLAVGGSWIAKRDLIQQKKWDTITDRAQKASRVVQEFRRS